MSMVTLATAVSAYKLVPAKQHYTSRLNGPPLGIVLHVTAGLQDLGMVGTDESMEGTIRWALNSRPQVSWHAGVDSDGVELCLPDWYTAWHAFGYNSRTIGIEISNLDARWDNKPAAWVEATLRHTARVAAAYCKKHNFPLKLSTKAEVDAAIRAGKKFGFTYHSYTSPGTRRDPGATFPWARFIKMVQEELEGPKPPTTPGELLSVDGSFGPKTVTAFQKYLKYAYKSGIGVDGSWGPSSRAYVEYMLNYEAKNRGWVVAPVTKTTAPGAKTLHTSRLRWLVGLAPLDSRKQVLPWDTETTKALQRLLNQKAKQYPTWFK